MIRIKCENIIHNLNQKSSRKLFKKVFKSVSVMALRVWCSTEVSSPYFLINPMLGLRNHNTESGRNGHI